MQAEETAKYRTGIQTLTLFIIILAVLATAAGIWSDGGPGRYSHESIRGETVLIYGEGVYQHMSEEVAVQGIAQDYVTLFVVLPVLLISAFRIRRASPAGKVLLSGTLAYLFVQYLFYMIMAAYSPLFLIYTSLVTATFFAFILSLRPVDVSRFSNSSTFPRRYIGVFLLANTALISLLWLSVVVPPLLDGSIYPKEVEHYTTLIVQGMDLSLLLPLAVLSAVMLLKRIPSGYLYASVYTVFLCFQMLALTAKIAAMGMMGYSIVPVIFIIPAILAMALFGAFRAAWSLRETNT